jgi:hypothetical protein
MISLKKIVLIGTVTQQQFNEHLEISVRFEVFTAVIMKNGV